MILLWLGSGLKIREHPASDKGRPAEAVLTRKASGPLIPFRHGRYAPNLIDILAQGSPSFGVELADDLEARFPYIPGSWSDPVQR